MADIHHWRLKVHSHRSRATGDSYDFEDRSLYSDKSSNSGSPAARRRLRPKFSTYFSSHLNGGPSAKHEPNLVDQTSIRRASDTASAPDIEAVVDSIQSKLMVEPYKALSPQNNSHLLLMVESYRNLKEEKASLEQQLMQETLSRQVLADAFHDLERKRDEEGKAHTAKVANLERLLLRSQNYTAGLSLSPQDDGLWSKTELESFPKASGPGSLDLHQSPGEAQSQAEGVDTVRRRPLISSPSQNMVVLSEQLGYTSSCPGLHVGTPPKAGYFMSKDISWSTHMDGQLSSRIAASKPDDVKLGDDFSNFSSSGDPLPDGIEQVAMPVIDMPDQSFEEIRQMAMTVSKRRGMAVGDVLPQLTDLFFGTSVKNSSENIQAEMEGGNSATNSTSVKGTTSVVETPPAPEKLSPSAALDTPKAAMNDHWQAKLRGHRRSFSFSPGDDKLVKHFRTQRSRQNSSAESSAVAEPLPSKSKKPFAQLSDQSQQPQQTDGAAGPSEDMAKITEKEAPALMLGVAKPQPRRDTSSWSSVQTVLRAGQVNHDRSASSPSSQKDAVVAMRRGSRASSLTYSVASSEISQRRTSEQGQAEGKGSLRSQTALIAATKAYDRGSSSSSRSGSLSKNERQRTRSGSIRRPSYPSTLRYDKKDAGKEKKRPGKQSTERPEDMAANGSD